MSEATLEQMEKLARQQRLQSAMEIILEKLRRHAKSITTEDVRSLNDNAEEGDYWTADIIAAVADLAIRNEKEEPTLEDDHLFTISLSQVVDNLHATVKANPEKVNTNILKTTQSIVRMMQKAIAHSDAPHPELEAELQQEYAKIVPKVEHGIVTKAEADNRHFLEAQAHGHTERGGSTAIAQSVAARRERQASISSASSNVRFRVNSRDPTPQNRPQNDTDARIPTTEMENGKAQNNAAATELLYLKEQRSSEKTPEKRKGISPNSSMRRRLSLSDSTNATRGDSMYDAASSKFHNYGSGDAGGGSENMPCTRKPKNSPPAI